MNQNELSIFKDQHINVCITGGAGFIGSHMVRKLHRAKKMGAPIGHIVVYDSLTYAADLNRLKDVDYAFVNGDILNGDLFLNTLRKYNISHILHFAAESHVDRSLIDSSQFLQTNVLGTAKVLEMASQYWEQMKSVITNPLFVQISTDEVYGYTIKPANETSMLNPGNPYAASKAAADQLVIACMNASHFPAMILRSSNNYGPNQNTEKFVPKMIERLRNREVLTIYGQGDQKRCWIHVEDYVEIIWQLIMSPKKGEVFNVRGDEVYSNINLATQMRSIYADILKVPIENMSKIAFVEDRKAHDFYYNITDQKLRSLYNIKRFNFKLIDFLVKTFEDEI